MNATANVQESSVHASARQPTGTLMATGVLFLSAPLYEAWDAERARQQYILRMCQRDGRGQMVVVAMWSGADADSFMRMHRSLLKPGRALTMSFKRLFAHNNEIHGLVQCASLAPDRWEHHHNQQPTPTLEASP